ncbi:hypothetical protein WJX81_000455 [Elliptochloris bilobata]|uniref:Nudix hydrolase domain-containing protein n=1 Tax=Elliptochloris bilobata TaxID=381761 RepID=A0AAW1QLQ5_9CHLO
MMNGHHEIVDYMSTSEDEEELFDVLRADNHQPAGHMKPRSAVHRDGDWHRAAHVWLFCQATGELLLQQRAAHKDSWPGLWDISAAGHVTAGSDAAATAQREVKEELGLSIPAEALEWLFSVTTSSVTNNGAFVNNEVQEVFLVTLAERMPPCALRLQESEVAGVRWLPAAELEARLRSGDPAHVPMAADSGYWRLFRILESRGSAAAADVRQEALEISLPGGARMKMVMTRRASQPGRS